jgi:hypothetical protein
MPRPVNLGREIYDGHSSLDLRDHSSEVKAETVIPKAQSKLLNSNSENALRAITT